MVSLMSYLIKVERIEKASGNPKQQGLWCDYMLLALYSIPALYYCKGIFLEEYYPSVQRALENSVASQKESFLVLAL